MGFIKLSSKHCEFISATDANQDITHPSKITINLACTQRLNKL